MAANPLSPALIPPDALRQLNERSDGPGWRQTLAHAAFIAVTASLWLGSDLPLPLRLVALVLGEISGEEFDQWVRPERMV